MDIGDDELLHDDAGGTNMLVICGTRKKKEKTTNKVEAKQSNCISKSMKRKLRRIEEEKEKKRMRIEALKTLEDHRIADNMQELMWSSSSLGKAKTMREKLRWALQLQRAGLPVPDDIRLFLDKKPNTADEAPSREENESASPKRRADEGPNVKIANEVSLRTKTTTKKVEDDEAEGLMKSGLDNSLAKLIAENKSSKRKQGCATQMKETSLGPSLGSCKKFVVRVLRSEDIEEQRSKLPIVMMEQEIMEAIHENDVVIVCGETGCGKTTQVPQFLYEAGYGSAMLKDRSGVIGVTQPRRIAVLTTAKRVAHELNLQLGKEVGFQVRYDRRVGEQSSIKFMTDGILLREIQSDFLLRKYSVILLDEAHERTINTDILIGMLSRIVPLRKKLHDEYCKQKGAEFVAPLKLVIMSATLRVEDFTANTKMFPTPPPVIHVTARQFPVKVHSSRKTELLDYETAAYKKVCAIHKKLPPGGILVFVTGRREVEHMCKRLRVAFAAEARAADSCKEKSLLSGSECQAVDMDTLQSAVEVGAEEEEEGGDVSDMEPSGLDEEEDEDSDASDSGVSDIDKEEATGVEDERNKSGKAGPKKPGPLHVLPLYAMLPAAAQLRVFAAVPEGSRLVVVSTNVAETSVTIPGIRYVVDCGRAKERKYSGSSGLSSFQVSWISKASADQRAGRAGRTGPGHCYQLYSKTHYHNNFPDFAPPEISLVPLEGVVLVLKCMGIDKVLNFPFPTAPERSGLVDAEKCLVALGALDMTSKLPTDIGRRMVVYPLNPRQARMLIAAIDLADSLEKQKQMKKKKAKARTQMIIACAIAMAAALSLENPLVGDDSPEEAKDDQAAQQQEQQKQEQQKQQQEQQRSGARAAHAKFLNPASDALTIVAALVAYEHSSSRTSFCRCNYLNEKVMKEMSALRQQLSSLLLQLRRNASSPEGSSCCLQQAGWEQAWQHDLPKTKLLPVEEATMVRAMVTGWPDRVARRLTLQEQCSSSSSSNHHRKRSRRCYQASSLPNDDVVYLRPSSSIFRSSPDFILYREVVRPDAGRALTVGADAATHTGKSYVSCATAVTGVDLVAQAAHLCSFSAPLAEPPPAYDGQRDEVRAWAEVRYGAHGWVLPRLHGVTIGNTAGDRAVAVAAFAVALLEGRVLPAMQRLRSVMAADPQLLLRFHHREGQLQQQSQQQQQLQQLQQLQQQRRAMELLQRLESVGVASKRELRAVWEREPRFLYEELQGWMQRKHRTQLEGLWDDLLAESRME